MQHRVDHRWVRHVFTARARKERVTEVPDARVRVGGVASQQNVPCVQVQVQHALRVRVTQPIRHVRVYDPEDVFFQGEGLHVLLQAAIPPIHRRHRQKR